MDELSLCRSLTWTLHLPSLPLPLPAAGAQMQPTSLNRPCACQPGALLVHAAHHLPLSASSQVEHLWTGTQFVGVIRGREGWPMGCTEMGKCTSQPHLEALPSEVLLTLDLSLMSEKETVPCSSTHSPLEKLRREIFNGVIRFSLLVVFLIYTLLP